MQTKKLHIHFMGIGGSGISAVAQIAHHQGFTVSGCDLNLDTSYIDKIKKLGIPIHSGHDPAHISQADIVAVSPAVFYQSGGHPEVSLARKKKILITWQEFLGKYLHKGKFLVCIAGTHGKTTTTSLAGQLLEKAGLDPTVEVGGTVIDWHNNIRLGKGEYFVSEADEFHNNYLHYHPNILILNNIEMDHPDFFPSKKALLASFKKFILQMQQPRVLITNRKSEWVQDMLKTLTPSQKANLKIIQYSIKKAKNVKFTLSHSLFTYQGEPYRLRLAGVHNISNSLGIIHLGKVLNIPDKIIAQLLRTANGVSRRMELVGQRKGVRVFDDYGPHPTAMAATLATLRQRFPHSRLWAIIEPHTFSRNIVLLPRYELSMRQANFVIISQIFASREKDPGNFSGADIAKACHHASARYIPQFEDIATTTKLEARRNDVIAVFGAGNSHKLSRQILAHL